MVIQQRLGLREELVADFERLEATDHPKVNRLSADVQITEAEVTRLIHEIEGVLWDGHEELRRRIHLVARTYSRDLEEIIRADAAEVAPV